MKRTTWLRAICVGMSVLLGASQAMAAWQSFGAAGVRFFVPDGWVTESQANVVVTRAPAGGTAIEFVAVQGGAEAAAAERQMLQGLARRMSGISITRPRTPLSQHGMSGFLFGGVGRSADGAPMEWFSIVLGSGPRGVLALVVGRAGLLEANLPIVRPVLDSISLMQ